MAQEKITLATARKLLKMLAGESLPASALPQSVTAELRSESLLGIVSHGSRSSYYLMDKEASKRYIENKYLNGHSIEDWIALTESTDGSLSRAALVNGVGDSKSLSVRTFRGFLVNCCEPLPVKLNGDEMTLSPTEGMAFFIQDPDSFVIPDDITIVGIENGENFRALLAQRHLFRAEKVLFVSRYPQSADLRNWLMHIPNPYIHFGDFDLAGVQIFLTEFYKYLGERSSFFVPEDIEVRIRNGNASLYDRQLAKFAKMPVTDTRLQSLVDMIHRYRKVYEQEGYIE